MGGESFQGVGSGDGVDLVLDEVDFRSIGVGVVDRGVEDAFEGTLVKKLAPMSFRFLLENPRPNLTTCQHNAVCFFA